MHFIDAIRGKSIAVILIAGTLVPSLAARADLQKNVLTGLNLFDYRFNLEKNILGDGWDFNATAPYGGQTYRMGFADLTLSGATSNISAGYTLRGLPSARFSFVTTAPVSYTLDANYGFQDFVAQGSIFIDIETSINALGFYDQTFFISNRGEFTTDGLGLTDAGTLDFDVGPIVVSGNIYADILAALTEPFFTATGTENPFAKFSQRATKVATVTETIEALTARAADGETLSDEQIGALVNNTILAAMLGEEPSPNLFDDVFVPPGLLGEVDESQFDAQTSRVPEPATLTLMALAMIVCYPRRRRTHS